MLFLYLWLLAGYSGWNCLYFYRIHNNEYKTSKARFKEIVRGLALALLLGPITFGVGFFNDITKPYLGDDNE